ncbi:MAG: SAM-dependent methyltransferase, partial [Betaproteobacteria bacterium]|nr:SAM-dependent methyltransferase [Betaproteobacteria bacterium]
MSVPAALYLLPVTLDETVAPSEVLPAAVLDRVRGIRDFVVENAKTARRFLSACGHPGPIADLRLGILDEHTREEDVAALLAPL